jgi:hypothetical protein
LLHLVGFDFFELPTLKVHGQTQIKHILIFCFIKSRGWGMDEVAVTQNLRKIAEVCGLISLFHRAFQFSKYNGPTNAFVYNKTLI